MIILYQNQVIFFRDQDISKENHVTFGRIFGDLHIHPAAPHVTNIPEMMQKTMQKQDVKAIGNRKIRIKAPLAGVPTSPK